MLPHIETKHTNYGITMSRNSVVEYENCKQSDLFSEEKTNLSR